MWIWKPKKLQTFQIGQCLGRNFSSINVCVIIHAQINYNKSIRVPSFLYNNLFEWVYFGRCIRIAACSSSYGLNVSR